MISKFFKRDQSLFYAILTSEIHLENWINQNVKLVHKLLLFDDKFVRVLDFSLLQNANFIQNHANVGVLRITKLWGVLLCLII